MIFIVACVFAAEYKVSESKETKISKIKEEGYEIIVPKGLFEGVLSVEKVSPTDFDASAGVLLQIKGKEGTFVHFPTPIEITFKISDMTDIERYLFVYRDFDNKLHCYFPDEINIKDKKITYSVYHTGEWYCGKGDKEQVLELISDRAATAVMVYESLKASVINDVKESFDDLLRALDIVDENTKEKFMSDFFNVIRSGSAKGTLEYISGDLKGKDQKTIDKDINNTLVWQIWRVLQRNTKIAGIQSLFLGKLEEAAKWVAGGEIDEAVECIKKAFDKVPQYEVFKSTLANSVNKQKQTIFAYVEYDELNDVYDLFTGEGIVFPGSDKYLDDPEACAEYLEYDKPNSRILRAYCVNLNIKPEDMTESSRVRFYNQFRRDLGSYLVDRQAGDFRVEDQKDNEILFINELSKVNLLSTFGNDKCFDDAKTFTLERRLSKIYSIRDAVFGITGIDSFEPKELCSLIVAYVQSYDGYDNPKFYTYLTEKNYSTEATGYEKYTVEKYNSTSEGGFFSALGEVLDILVNKNGVPSHKETGKYNLVDIRDDKDHRFSGGKGEWTYKDDYYKVFFEAKNMPGHISPGSSEDIKLYIEKARDDTVY